MPTLTTQDIEAIVQQFESGHWSALEIESGDSRLFLARQPGSCPSWDTVTSAQVAPPTAAAPQLPTSTGKSSAPAAALTPESSSAGFSLPHGHVIIPSPSMGTFYRAAKPGASPYVEVGQSVTPDTELGLLEVMKLFTTINAGVKGRITQVLAADAAAIERGEPLFVIDTNG